MKDNAGELHQKAMALHAKILEGETLKTLFTWEYRALPLYEMHKSGLYKYLYGDSGGETEDIKWAQYLRGTDILPSTDWRLRKLVEYWVENLNYSPEKLRNTDTKKLTEAIQYIEKGVVTPEEVIEKALIESVCRRDGKDFTPFLEFKKWLREL